MIILAIWGYLKFHVYFESYEFLQKANEILIGIAVIMRITCRGWGIAILTLLSLLIDEHGMSFHLLR